MQSRHMPAAMTCALACLCGGTASLAQPVLVPIPILPGTNHLRVIPRAISADGSVVAGSNDSLSTGNTFEAFIWQAQTESQPIPQFAGGWLESIAFGVSSVGPTVTGYGLRPNYTDGGFRWSPSTGTQYLPIPVGGGASTYPTAITPDAAVIVGNSSLGCTRWGPSGPEVLPNPDGSTGAAATAVSPDGSVIAGYSSSPAQSLNATLWRPGIAPVRLGAFPGREVTVARAVDATGANVVGEAVDPSGYGAAFRWSAAGGMQLIGFVAQTDYDAGLEGISADGRTAVGYSHGSAGFLGSKAAIWRESRGFQFLADVLTTEYGVDLADWSLTDATAITPDGSTIIGWGTRDGALFEGWLIHLTCYPNCDASTTPPVLNVNDFICFLNKFAGGDSYANCDQSTIPPALNVNDFICFLNRFAAGCP